MAQARASPSTSRFAGALQKVEDERSGRLSRPGKGAATLPPPHYRRAHTDASHVRPDSPPALALGSARRRVRALEHRDLSQELSLDDNLRSKSPELVAEDLHRVDLQTED